MLFDIPELFKLFCLKCFREKILQNLKLTFETNPSLIRLNHSEIKRFPTSN